MDIINAVASNVDTVPNDYDLDNPPFKKFWPGDTFLKGSEQHKALMGTPHGKGISWIINKHPKEMPNKDVEAITIFVTRPRFQDVGYHYNLLFILTG